MNFHLYYILKVDHEESFVSLDKNLLFFVEL